MTDFPSRFPDPEGEFLTHDEVRSALGLDRAAPAERDLAVPSAVIIRDPERDAMRRVELRIAEGF